MSGSILDRYLGGRPADTMSNGNDTISDVEGTETIGCFGWHRGIRDFPRMLELRKKDGSIVAVGYAWIERVDFDPEEGITIHALGKKVRITGHNLNAEVRPSVRLYQGIARQRVGWVQESDNSSGIAATAGETVVTRLES